MVNTPLKEAAQVEAGVIADLRHELFRQHRLGLQYRPGFDLLEFFTLGKNTSRINPVTEKVTLQIGTFSVTIPAGSFRQHPNGRFAFEGVIDGVRLEVQIVPLGNNIFLFKAECTGVNLAGLTNPVTVVLTIGIDSDTTAVTADLKAHPKNGAQ